MNTFSKTSKGVLAITILSALFATGCDRRASDTGATGSSGSSGTSGLSSSGSSGSSASKDSSGSKTPSGTSK